MSEPSSVYVSRKEAEEFEGKFAEALKQPADSPVVFQIFGIGGVGKTTLIKRLRQKHEQPANSAKRLWQKHEEQAKFAEFSFHLEVVIQDPIELMDKLYKQLSKLPTSILMRDVLASDPFEEKCKKYREALLQLKKQPLPGRKAVETDQLNAVEQLVKGTATFALPILTQGRIDPATAEDVADAAIAGSTTVLSVFDLIREHSVTEKDEELQNLILKPLPELTKAFVEGLSKWAKKCPVVVILDTYEKAPSFVDTWLCNVLLPLLPEFREQPIRWVIAGRYNLVDQKEVWRKVQQDHQLLNGYYGHRLKRFNEEDQVKKYLQAVNITEPREIKEILKETKGLPYSLNLIREAKLKGLTIDLTQDIHNFFFRQVQTDDLNPSEVQMKMLKTVACCRWFDKPLVEYLADQQGSSFPVDADGHLDWFEWLKQLDFLDSDNSGYFRLDDAVRDTLRNMLFREESDDDFHKTHGWLAAYFEKQANQIIAVDRSEVEKYNNGDWRRYTIEAIYHMLFSRFDDYDYQRKFLSHLFAEHFLLNQIEVVREPVAAIDAEATLQKHQLLPAQTQQFLNNLEMVVLGRAWDMLDKTPDQYPEEGSFNETKVEQALQVCFSQIESLKGLPKFAALFYKSKRYSNNQRVEWLREAKAHPELIATDADPEFSSSLFLWHIGNDFYELGEYQEAIASFDKAVEIKPDDLEAWIMSALKRYEEASTSFGKAVEIKSDYHEAWLFRGIVLNALAQWEEASASFDNALQFKLDYYQAGFFPGIVLNALAQWEEAIASMALKER